MLSNKMKYVYLASVLSINDQLTERKSHPIKPFSAQCYPHLACPLYASFFMQLHEAG